MNAFVQFAAQELPRINQALDKEVEALPVWVQPPVRHVLGAGGKRLRPILSLITARGLGYAGDDAYTLACAMEFLHSATLLHDDIVDGADLRRGRPSAHVKFDTTTAVLAGDIMLAMANRIVADYDVPRLNAVMAEAIVQTATGEILEIAKSRDPGLSEEDYLTIITGKTAFLIEASCRCGAILAGADDETVGAMGRFGMNLGIAFQLVDDALDYSSTEAVAGKPIGADLREGKMTLPLIFYIRSLSEAERETLCKGFRAGDLDDEAIVRAVREVHDKGFDAEVRAHAGAYLDKAETALERFPDGPEKDMLCEALAYVQKREK